MIFLISYDREKQRLTRPVESFSEEQRAEARRRRFDVQELLANEWRRYEVVLLEADSEAVIRRTHARYFENEAVLIQGAKTTLRRMIDRLNRDGRNGTI